MNVKVAILTSVLEVFSPSLQVDQVDMNELECMAENIFFESRAKSLDEMKAVANVTLNRVVSSRYPDTICEVVYQDYQFSWTNNKYKDMTSKVVEKNILEEKAWEDSVEVAVFATTGQLQDNTDNALFYHTHNVDPSWNKEMKVTYETDYHVYYTDNKQLAYATKE